MKTLCIAGPDLQISAQMYKIKIYKFLLMCYFCEICIRTLNMLGSLKMGLI